MTAQYYPILLHLEGLSCLIVGFGEVGRRKLAMLLPARPARVRILDPAEPSEEGMALLAQAVNQSIDIQFISDPFSVSDLDGMTLVFTCSGDRALNTSVATLCRERHILCNCADNPPAGSFHVPVVVRKHPLTATLSTDRASPALSRRWKSELADFLEPRAPMAALMGRLRPLVLALGASSDSNRELFRRLASSGLEQALAGRDYDRARFILTTNLPEALRPSIPQLLAELSTGDCPQ